MIIVHLHLVVDVVIDVVVVAVDVVAVVGGSGAGGKPFRMFIRVLKIKPLQIKPPQYNTIFWVLRGSTMTGDLQLKSQPQQCMSETVVAPLHIDMADHISRFKICVIQPSCQPM